MLVCVSFSVFNRLFVCFCVCSNGLRLGCHPIYWQQARRSKSCRLFSSLHVSRAFASAHAPSHFNSFAFTTCKPLDTTESASGEEQTLVWHQQQHYDQGQCEREEKELMDYDRSDCIGVCFQLHVVFGSKKINWSQAKPADMQTHTNCQMDLFTPEPLRATWGWYMFAVDILWLSWNWLHSIG